MPADLALIASVANQLLEANASTATGASQQVLAQLVEHFDLRYAFLRYSDHDTRTSVLAAEWPTRTDVADPDPFAVVSFTSDHPALAVCANGKELVTVHRKFDGGCAFPVFTGGRRRAPLVGAAPLVAGNLTTGALGFVKRRGRRWNAEAKNTLTMTASLFAQFQARVSAEELLRHLADHDDLTGLPNRRALLSHLADRLAPQRAGPVAVLYIDLDRLKAINDLLGHAAGDRYIRGLADRLRSWAGGRGMVARLGGDEFVVVRTAAGGFVHRCRPSRGRPRAGSAVVNDIESTTRTLAKLKDLGVQVSIEDYGTGYAVLSHLKRLPVDALKIDPQFVRDLGTDVDDMAIVRAIIALADAFGRELIADGVQTPAAAKALMHHGCHRAQGYLLSRPIAGDTMEALMSAGRLPMPFLTGDEALTRAVV